MRKTLLSLCLFSMTLGFVGCDDGKAGKAVNPTAGSTAPGVPTDGPEAPKAKK